MFIRREELQREKEAFRAGIKPALITNEEGFQQGYPYVRVTNQQGDEIYCIFFQDGSQKNQFLKETEGIPSHSPDFAKAVGKALGYPEPAIAQHVSLAQNLARYPLSQEQKNRIYRLENVYIFCGGFNCNTDVKRLKETITILWNQTLLQEIATVFYHPDPTVPFMRTSRNEWIIPAGDYKLLERVANTLRKQYAEAVKKMPPEEVAWLQKVNKNR